MPHIDWINEDEADGDLASLYRQYFEANPQREQIPGILKAFSHRPDFLHRVMQFSNELHFSDGHLNQRTKELIASLVSALNQCPY